MSSALPKSDCCVRGRGEGERERERRERGGGGKPCCFKTTFMAEGQSGLNYVIISNGLILSPRLWMMAPAMFNWAASRNRLTTDQK